MFAKLFVLFAIVACAFGAVLKDVTGGTYDLTTGQYSSAITGHVFNTAPVVGAYAAPVAAYGYAAPYAAYGGLYF